MPSLAVLLSALGVLVALLVVVAPAAESERAEGSTPSTRIDVRSLAAGEDHTCAITASGGLRCWGSNAFGQLAQGNIDDIGDDTGESSVAVGLGADTAVAVTSGDNHSCVLLSTGVVRCWGQNDAGQLGQGNVENIGDEAVEPKTVVVDLGGAKAVDVVAGVKTTCALLESGSLRCWGDGSYGKLLTGNLQSVGDGPGETTVAVNVGGGAVTALASGGNYFCALTSGGSVRCWGYNFEGQLGRGDENSIGDEVGETPAAVNLSGHEAKAISTGLGHACVILDDGNVRCWGGNWDGQLAQGHILDIGDQAGETPVPVNLAGRRAVALGSGDNTACAILDDGSLRCWGNGFNGQLGQGTTQNAGDDAGETTVALDTGGHRVLAVSGGQSHVCAAWDNRSVHCWGAGTEGQLGVPGVSEWGRVAGQTPGLTSPVLLGGEKFGRDLDADGVRDAKDACPTKPAPGTKFGCEVTLRGKVVKVSAFLERLRPAGICPARATVVVKKGAKVLATRTLATVKLTRNGVKGCLVKGKVTLTRKPGAEAVVKIRVKGVNLEARTIRAVRV
jgi:alpha-tubulin suppressor-like RCC1 family protein